MGIEGVAKAREEFKQQFSGNGDIDRLRLEDGDTAEVVFLSDGKDDLVDSAKLHGIERISSKGNTYSDVEPCKKWYGQELTGQDCDYCKSEIEKIRRISYQFGAWLWVRSYFHSRNLENKDWQQVRLSSGRVIFVETANKLVFWRQGFGKGDYLWNMIAAGYENDGALNKRFYRIQRTGAKMDTTYNVMPTDEKLSSEDFALLYPEWQSLPKALDVLSKRVLSLDGSAVIVTETNDDGGSAELPLAVSAPPAPADFVPAAEPEVSTDSLNELRALLNKKQS